MVTRQATISAQDSAAFLMNAGTPRLGAQPFHGRIVILINEWTNSAAEMLANFAAENECFH